MIQNFDCQKILKTALKNGGDFAEIYAEESEPTQIISEDKKIEKIVQGVDRGVGIRVIHNHQTAYGYTNEISEKALLALAGKISEAVQAKTFGRPIKLKSTSSGLSLPVEIPPWKTELEKKVGFVTEAARIGWEAGGPVKQVKVVYGDNRKNLWIANSLGALTEEERSYTLFFVHITAATNGLIQTGYYPVGGYLGLELLEKETPEKVAREAVRQAFLALKAKQSPAGRMPVVLSSEAGGTMVHEAIGHGLEADLASEKLSVYHGKKGQKIATPQITIWDDATLPTRRGSFLFDDEGTPSEKTVLVDKGILKNYMYDHLMGMKDGVPSTGNGRRESYRFKPICRMTNTIIAPGTDDPASILRSTPKGLFVKKMGGGQVNTVNGDFVFEVNEGYLIENGRIGEPVRGAMLTGNGPEVLRTIDRVGSDLGFGIGTCGKDGQGVPVGDAQPTLRIPELTVGGCQEK
ncbi:MAG: TldD/PmbA family protein [Deltaproteobacteria bacterium]|nr:TldD/PmbA family protein [Deltaproteobacteria bacterium]